MSDYRLTHLANATLLDNLVALVTTDRSTTAALLAHIAEVDARRLYLPAAYASMFAYCVGELRLSEDAAYKRIRAARTARQFPQLFEEIAAGRLHLAALCLLTPHLTVENLGELVVAATHHDKAAIESRLAGRFAPAEGSEPARSRATVTALRSPAGPESLDPTQVDCLPRLVEVPAAEGSGASSPPAGDECTCAESLVPGPVVLPIPEPVPAWASPRFLVRIPIDEATHAKLRRAQTLLGHSVPGGDLAQVLDRALDGLIVKLEKRKVAGAEQPRSVQPHPVQTVQTVQPAQPAQPAPPQPARPAAPRSRLVPAAVRRAVWTRDEGQCTFPSDTGRRCAARRALEFDHVVPFARGGEATLAGLRLRCRPHNQYEAERAFGTEFMQRKRERGAGAQTRRPEGQAVHDRGDDGVAAARSSSPSPPEKGPR